MTNFGSSLKAMWAPPSCTLPTIEQPLRQRQFAELFADAVTAVERVDPTTTRLSLRSEPQIAARAAELSTRETGCCSFFTFTLTFTEGAVRMSISVPPAQTAVLDALTDQARAVSSAGAA